jgi:hypothetical protein
MNIFRLELDLMDKLIDLFCQRKIMGEFVFQFILNLLIEFKIFKTFLIKLFMDPPLVNDPRNHHV